MVRNYRAPTGSIIQREFLVSTDSPQHLSAKLYAWNNHTDLQKSTSTFAANSLMLESPTLVLTMIQRSIQLKEESTFSLN